MATARYVRYRCTNPGCVRSLQFDRTRLTDEEVFQQRCDCGWLYEWTGRRIQCLTSTKKARLPQAARAAESPQKVGSAEELRLRL